MPLARVLPRGQITIPQEIREAVGLESGDTVQVRVTGPDTIQITVFPRRTLDDWIQRYQLSEPGDYERAVAEGEADSAAEAIAQIERNRQELTEGSL
jgi:AbrB family looped-hinge helix DNA binding protein